MKKLQKNSADIEDILSYFMLQGHIAKSEPFGSGHIHDTFHVQTKEDNSPDYLLQRINHFVFQNVPALMKNIAQVTSHLRHKLAAIPGANPDKEVLTLIPTFHGLNYHQDEHGNFWRLYLFLKSTRSYDVVQTAQQAYEGGRAFGRFQALLSDLEADQLYETIPDFHNLESRLLLFGEALNEVAPNRAAAIKQEINFVKQRADQMCHICRLGRQGKLPLRITHNDTKFNNILLNTDDKAQCVIDLDTVMPGYIAYDFGDAIRTIINTAPEDEKNLEKINLNISLFESFTSGYLRETSSFITEEEIASLPAGVTLLPYMMGLRFLTDYLDGDTYYKIDFPEHNLQRARAQFKLVELLEAKQEQLQHIITEIAREYNTAKYTMNPVSL